MTTVGNQNGLASPAFDPVADTTISHVELSWGGQ